jgi:hypothetical protein
LLLLLPMNGMIMRMANKKTINIQSTKTPLRSCLLK